MTATAKIEAELQATQTQQLVRSAMAHKAQQKQQRAMSRPYETKLNSQHIEKARTLTRTTATTSTPQQQQEEVATTS